MATSRRIAMLLANVLAAWLCASGAALAGAAFEWSLERHETALGEPVMLTLERAPDTPGPGLDAFDAGILEQDFEVYGRMLGRSAGRETLVLELYPLRCGELRLPLPGADARPPLRVHDRGPGALRASFRLFTEPETWRVRQPVRLVLEACVRGMLLWQQPDPGFVTGLAVHPLGRASLAEVRDERGCVPEQWSWSLTPTTGGQYRIEFGMLEATRFGQRLRFPLPSLHAEVAAAPDWLPAGLAQTGPWIEALAIPEHGRSGDTLSVRLQLDADYSESVLSALLHAQLSGDANWSRYPPDLLPLRSEAVVPRWEIRLHARPERAGALPLPALRLPWFDADAEALQAVVFEAPAIRVEPPPAGPGWIITGGLLLAALLAAAAHTLAPAWAWRAQRRALVRRIMASDSFDTLHRALVTTAPCPGRRETRSYDAALGRWARDFNRHWHAPALTQLSARLDAARFGRNADVDWAKLREALLDCLARATPYGR
jgi:hypothetical protein